MLVFQRVSILNGSNYIVNVAEKLISITIKCGFAMSTIDFWPSEIDKLTPEKIFAELPRRQWQESCYKKAPELQTTQIHSPTPTIHH